MEKLMEMSEFFNDRAPIYDAKHLEHLDGGMASKQIVASFLPDNTHTLIDFGIGTGLELEEIFKVFPNVKITGVDMAEGMLDQLRKKYAGKSIELHCANYLDYDFGSERYDAALSVMTLHHYNHEVKTELYRKVNRCLKQNGTYVECDYMISEFEYDDAQEMEDFFFAEGERIKREQGVLPGKQYHYDTPCTVSNQKKMLLKAGFKNIHEVWRMKNVVVLVAKK